MKKEEKKSKREEKDEIRHHCVKMLELYRT